MVAVSVDTRAHERGVRASKATSIWRAEAGSPEVREERMKPVAIVAEYR